MVKKRIVSEVKKTMISYGYEIVLVAAVIVCYIALKYLVGKRLYITETSYITSRELLLPLVLVWVMITSRIVLQIALFPYILGVLSLISLLVLIFRKKPFNPFVFIHRFFSIMYLLLIVVGIGLEIIRWFIA